MKRTRKIIYCILLCASLAACASPPNPEPSVESGIPSAPEPEESAALFHDDFITCAGNVEITWTPDYERSEWAESTPINLFVRFSGEIDPDLQLIEDEANHYLHQAGKDYCLHIVGMNLDDFLNSYNLDDQFSRTQDGTVMDMYMTFDYKAAVAAGEVLNLTDYLQSPEGQKVYARYDEMVWAQLEDENGQIYGIPSNPIAAKRMVYYYYPQIAEYLSLDRERFTGDLRDLEGEFSRMEEAGILPLRLALLPENPLLSSLFGLENYGEIFAIRHEEEGLEAVNVLEDDAWMDFYRLLGRWRAEGHILYSPEALRDWGLSEEEALAEEARWEEYLYPLFELAEINTSSARYEMAAEGVRMTCAYCVPQVPAYITEDVNSNILVINRDTAVPDACLDLLTLLKTDTTLMRLLYCGIEHYHYQWEDERIIFRSAGYAGGLGYEFDRRFLNAASEEQFNREFEDLNYGVDFGLAYSSPCAFSDEELALKYQACREIMEDNLLVFRGYYGEDTGSRLENVKKLLYDAGYQELIAALNSGNTP